MQRNDFLDRARDLSDQKLLKFLGRLALVLWLAPVPARAVSVPAAPLAEPGAHFIVLIDDSGDADSVQRNLASVLPEYLYTGRRDRLPLFRPDHDHLSAAFFTIHPGGGGDACKARKRYSVRPEHMFQLVSTPASSVRTREDFASLLRGWLSLPCRRQGNLSPIVTAQSLILPFLGERLPAAPLFSRTFLILAHNGKFNASTSPIYELRQSMSIQSDIVRGWRLLDVPEAEKEVQRQAGLFRFEQLTDASRKVDGLYLDAFEVQPLAPPPQMQISPLKEVLLDRVAISRQQLRIVPKSPALAEVHIELPDPHAEGGQLVPLRLAWRFEGANGGSWRIGSKVYPNSEQALDLERCQPLCRKENNQLVVPVLDLGGDRPLLARGDGVPREKGRLVFRVAFRYRTPGSYGLLSRETPPQTVLLNVVPAERVPGNFFASDVELDNAHLADLWQPTDQEEPAGGLTQEEARDRILQERKWINLLLLAGAIAATIAILIAAGFYFYRTAYHRPFRPVLEWAPAEEVVVSFDRSDASRLLVGTLTVRNPMEVPWFGRKLGNEEQPTRHAELAFSHQPLETYGLRILKERTPIGFLDTGTGAEGEAAGLVVTTEEAVSDGKRVFVFLASDAIRDLYGKSAAVGNATIPVELGARMEWRTGDRADGPLESAEAALPFVLRIEPEEPRPPQVKFLPAGEPKLFFRPGRAVEVGRFAFTSRAGHSFARPFTGEYLVQTSRGNVPLGGDPIHLAHSSVSLESGARGEIPVLLECDGKAIPNPDPAVQDYELRLVGPQDAGSEPGPHQVLLFRDPTRAEIELLITYLGETREIFWGADGVAQQRLRLSEKAAGRAEKIAGNVLHLGRPFELRFGEAHPALNLLGFQVGNSAAAGRGVVEMVVVPRLVFAEGFAERVHLRHGRELGDLLRLYELDTLVDDPEPDTAQFRVQEGEPPQSLDLRIEPGHIERIDGAFIVAENCLAEVDLRIRVRDDRGQETGRTLRLRLPIELERLPGPNWLCIDFGTSAIAAAVGSGVYDSFRMIPLQDVPVRKDGRGHRLEDGRNPEAGTPFLPSLVICNADLRQEAAQDGWRPGYPMFRPASLRPGDPSFLGLPAITSQLGEAPGRVIFSLKSWLGTGVRELRLQEDVRFLRNGHEVKERVLPLDALVESGFAALAEAYLHGQHADQIVICHPNTFTVRHRERLHAIASRALMRAFKISSPKHIRLLSESDAVAYHYCSQRMLRDPREGKERLLTYDFGAGTLDLSVISLEWNRDPFYPKKWTVEGRIGVPVAGNYLDEILARILDEILRSPEVMTSPALEYKYRIVAETSASSEPTSPLRRAIQQLHSALREAKHQWDGSSPFIVPVGGCKGPWGVVLYEPKAGDLPDSQIGPDGPSIFVQGDLLALSIPASQVHGHPRMAEFLEFVTRTVVNETLSSVGLKPADIDTIIVSGRGALWPGLRTQLMANFSAAAKPDWSVSGISMKEAVVRGAIARQELLRLTEEHPFEGGKIGVLLSNGKKLVSEEEWGPGRPIDLTASPSFRLVQVAVRHPDPQRDAKSLRKHFYIDLSSQLYLRESLWRDDPRLYVEKVRRNGQSAIVLRNAQGQEIVDSLGAGVSVITNPPWPIGEILLDPKG